MPVVINRWTFVPEPEEDEPCFMTYELQGNYVVSGGDGAPLHFPFHVRVSMEIDGRDGEYVQLSGLDMNFNSEDEAARNRWDELLAAFETTPGLTADMEQRANAYYSG